MKPFAESCEQNKHVILDVIRPLLQDAKDVFEIGSGTGQHAVFFAGEMNHLTWHTSDRAENLEGIRQWLNEAKLTNTRGPIELDVRYSQWPAIIYDAIFSANTLHIMSWSEVEALFEQVANVLGQHGHLLVYGPFNYQGEYTSESNRHFDQWLKNRNPQSGIKHFEDVNHLAQQAGLILENDFEMPANNRILHWKKS